MSGQVTLLSEREKENIRIRVEVVKAFLSLFIQQLSPKTHPASRITLVDEGNENQEYTYELAVFRRPKKPDIRRMSITMIGEASGSASRCFKVRYDNIIVVKMPQQPIKDYNVYIGLIRAEGRIAQKLDDRKRIIAPEVSTVIKRIHPFPDEEDYPEAELEEKYIQLLMGKPGLRKFLKIDGSFSFFMDMSKHVFLADVIRDMHSRDKFQERAEQNIKESFDFFGDITNFELKHGLGAQNLYLRMNEVFRDFEKKARKIADSVQLDLSAYEYQEIFVNALANAFPKPHPGRPGEFTEEIRKLILDFFENQETAISEYQKSIENYIRQLLFTQYRPRMGVLIKHLLVLIQWLWDRQVSIRDLKPHNIFVAGEVESPKFFQPDDNSFMGLIDFETALYYGESQSETEQPMQGGTPSYATPSHFFPNRVLKNEYADLKRIFHFQDMYAVAAMIYNIITGQNLFERTGKVLSNILKIRWRIASKKVKYQDVFPESRNYAENGQDPMKLFFKSASRIFWKSAEAEFTRKLQVKAQTLRAVEVPVTEDVRNYFLERLYLERNHLEKKIKARFSAHPEIAEGIEPKDLARLPAPEIRNRFLRLERILIEKGKEKELSKAGRIVGEIRKLRIQYIEKNLLIRTMEAPEPRMNAYELIRLLFNTVRRGMYKTEWKHMTDRYGIEEAEDPEQEIKTKNASVVYEKTLLEQATATMKGTSP